MFCKNCGRQLPDDATFCHGCGARRSGGESNGNGGSGSDVTDQPHYAKENDLDRSGLAVDSDRKKFSLTDPGRKRFSLSDSGQDKFSLSDRSRKDEGDGIVRISARREPSAPPKEPTGFVNPLKDSGGAVFRNDGGSAGNDPAPAQDTASSAPAQNTAPSAQPEQPPPREPDAILDGDDGATGFVNPLKETGRDIQWGSDGDRNQQTPDIEEIDSHMGFAIIVTILGCCNCINLVLGIMAIVFASQVPKYIEEGKFDQAKSSANTARILCWISLGVMLLSFVMSTVMGVFTQLLEAFSH